MAEFILLANVWLLFMILIDPDLKNDTYQPIAFTFGARYCDKLLRNLRDRLLKENGLTRKRKSARDVLLETENILSESAKAERMASGMNMNSSCSSTTTVKIHWNWYRLPWMN